MMPNPLNGLLLNYEKKCAIKSQKWMDMKSILLTQEILGEKATCTKFKLWHILEKTLLKGLYECYLGTEVEDWLGEPLRKC
jgi:hypothetical protein